MNWNETAGPGGEYSVILYVKDSSIPIQKSVKQGPYEKYLDKEFGYGNQYSAEVIAFSENGVTNSDKTPFELIGKE